MADRSFLDWPFLEDHHRVVAAELDACLLYTSDAADE